MDREHGESGSQTLELQENRVSFGGMMELCFKFLVGGVAVSLFAALGDVFQPKRFAGLAAAAPSVALSSLALAFKTHGAEFVAIEGRSMAAGAIAFCAYAAVCVHLARRHALSIGVAAALGWTVWIAVAGAEWAMLTRFV